MDAEGAFLANPMQIHSPEWDDSVQRHQRAIRLTAEPSNLSCDDVAKVREIFSELTDRKVESGMRRPYKEAEDIRPVWKS
jgi:hypothetical protein